MTGTEKRKFTVDMRDAFANVTWENSGPELTFHLWTGEADLTVIASTEVIRQLRQMLSWAAGLANFEGNSGSCQVVLFEQFLASDGAVRPSFGGGGRSTVPPENYLG